MPERKRIVILGAAGRDFHNFNMVFRDDPSAEVVAFTAAQIPGIAGRSYPSSLAGPLYPRGIPIREEAELEAICREARVDQVVLAYSDLPHVEVMHLASRVLALGADFLLLGPQRTMLRAPVPVIAVSAVRTGCGKSPTVRWLSRQLRARGVRPVVLRHPMPYGDLEAEAVQRFATSADLITARCTIEEREEYEPHLACGTVVYAGVDYARIVAAASREADLLLWDGGNNDFPFLRPDLYLVLVDALRPGQETDFHPGETVLRMADVVILAKCDHMGQADLDALRRTVLRVNPGAQVVLGVSPLSLSNPAAVKDARVLVVEDGPTITHGGMAVGAGYAAALEAGAREIVDPRPFAAGVLREVFARYPHIGPVLPAVGYQPEQLAALAATIEASDCAVVVSATPVDLGSIVPVTKPIVRVTYEFAEAGEPVLEGILNHFLKTRPELLREVPPCGS